MKKGLIEWKADFSRAHSEYSKTLDWFKKYMDQFDGSLENDKISNEPAESSTICWNITRELIESEISNNLPIIKVKPVAPDEVSLELAEVIENMERSEMERLPFKKMNDMAERITKIFGINGYMVEWDNSITTHDTVGAVNVSLRSAQQIIPQAGIYEIEDMDYIFLVFNVTKSYIKNKFGIDVSDETIEKEYTDDDTNSTDIVTQIYAYFWNDKKRLGLFSWAGDTVIIDDDDYSARKKTICVKCGKEQAEGEDKCSKCKSKKWETQSLDFEELEEDLHLRNGQIIPALSPLKDEDGNEVFEDYESPMFEPDENGEVLPVLDYVFGDKMEVIGAKPRMEIKQRPVMVKTKLEYYKPTKFPIIIQRNISKHQSFTGYSECEVIRGLQQSINKLLSKAHRKALIAGSIITVPEDLNITLKDLDGMVVKMTTQQKTAFGIENFNFNPEQDMQLAQQLYIMAKSLLGVTESFQGKPDATAQSGRAKEAQIAQSSAIQASKSVLKNQAYAEMGEVIFQYHLAYSDETREFSRLDDQGKPIKTTFSRYDFLKVDEAGNPYYDDNFLFEVDTSGVDPNNKLFMLDDVRYDYGIGAYGDPSQPQTRLRYWQEKARIGYPGANGMIKEVQREIAEQEQQLQVQLQQLALQNQELQAQLGQSQQLTQQIPQMIEQTAQTAQEEGASAVLQEQQRQKDVAELNAI